MIYAETSFDKAVDDALEEMSRKDKTMADKPRNPFATEDFANAIKEATEKMSRDFKKIGEQIQVDFPFMAYDDVCPEYGGRMRLNYLNGIGGWQDVLTVLIAHGYEVTAHTEVASEVEREVDGIDKWIVIEFDEVE